MEDKLQEMLTDPKDFIQAYQSSLRLGKESVMDTVAELMKYVFEELEFCANRPKRAFLLSRFLSKQLIFLRQLQPSIFNRNYNKYFKDKQMIDFIAAYIDLELKASECKADTGLCNRISIHIEEFLKICPEIKVFDVLFHITRIRYKYLEYLRKIFEKYFQPTTSAHLDLDTTQFLRYIIVCKKWYDEELKKEKNAIEINEWRQKAFEICSSSYKVPVVFLENEEIPINLRLANNIFDCLLNNCSLATIEEIYKKISCKVADITVQPIMSVVDLTVEETISTGTNLMDLTLTENEEDNISGNLTDKINKCTLVKRGTQLISIGTNNLYTIENEINVPELECIKSIVKNIIREHNVSEIINLDSDCSDCEIPNESNELHPITMSSQIKVIPERDKFSARIDQSKDQERIGNSEENPKKVIFSTQKPIKSSTTQSSLLQNILLDKSKKISMQSSSKRIEISAGIEDLLDDWNDDDTSNIQSEKNSASSTITSSKHSLLAASQKSHGHFDENQLPQRIIFSTPLHRISQKAGQRRNSFDFTRTNVIPSPVVVGCVQTVAQRNAASSILIRRNYKKSPNNTQITSPSSSAEKNQARRTNEKMLDNASLQRRHSMDEPGNLDVYRRKLGKPKKNVTFQDEIRINYGNVTTNVDPEKNTFLRKLAVQINNIKQLIETKDKWVPLTECRKFGLKVKRKSRFVKNSQKNDKNKETVLNIKSSEKVLSTQKSAIPRKRGIRKNIPTESFNSSVYLGFNTEQNKNRLDQKIQKSKIKQNELLNVNERELEITSTCNVKSDYDLRSPISNPQISSTVQTKKKCTDVYMQRCDGKKHISDTKTKRKMSTKGKSENTVTSSTNSIKKRRKNKEAPNENSFHDKNEKMIDEYLTDTKPNKVMTLVVDTNKFKKPSNSDSLNSFNDMGNKSEKIIVSIKRTKNVQKIIESAVIEPSRCETDSGIDSVLNTPERSDECSSVQAGSQTLLLSQMAKEMDLRTSNFSSKCYELNVGQEKQKSVQSCKNIIKNNFIDIPDSLEVNIKVNSENQLFQSEVESLLNSKRKAYLPAVKHVFDRSEASSSPKSKSIFQEKIDEYKIIQHDFLNVKSMTHDIFPKKADLKTFFERQLENRIAEDENHILSNDTEATKTMIKRSTSMLLPHIDPQDYEGPLSARKNGITEELSKLTVNDSSSLSDQIPGKRKRRQSKKYRAAKMPQTNITQDKNAVNQKHTASSVLPLYNTEVDKEKPKKHRRKRKSLYHHVPEEVLCSNASISPSFTDEYDDPLEIPSTSTPKKGNFDFSPQLEVIDCKQLNNEPKKKYVKRKISENGLITKQKHEIKCKIVGENSESEIKSACNKKKLCQEIEALKNDKSFGKFVDFQHTNHDNLDDEKFVVVRETRRKFNVVSSSVVLKKDTKRKRKSKINNEMQDNKFDEKNKTDGRENEISNITDDIVSPEYEPLGTDSNSHDLFKSPDSLDEENEKEDHTSINRPSVVEQPEVRIQNSQEIYLTMMESNHLEDNKESGSLSSIQTSDFTKVVPPSTKLGTNGLEAYKNKSISSEDIPYRCPSTSYAVIPNTETVDLHNTNNHQQRISSASFSECCLADQVSHATISHHQYDEVYVGNSSPSGFNNGSGIMVSSDSEMDDMNELFDYSDISDDDKQPRTFEKINSVEKSKNSTKTENNGYFRELQCRIEGIECESIEYSTNEKYKDKLLSATTNAYTSTLTDYISHPIKNFNCVFEQNDILQKHVDKKQLDKGMTNENEKHERNDHRNENAEKEKSESKNFDITTSHFSGITIDSSLVIATNDFVSDNHMSS